MAKMRVESLINIHKHFTAKIKSKIKFANIRLLCSEMSEEIIGIPIEKKISCF